jgi:hypothetical protein
VGGYLSVPREGGPAEGVQLVKNRIWVYTGTGTILGLGLLWWATEQLVEIQRTVGSTFEYPKGRVLLWLVTLIATGFAFGLAAAAVRHGAVRGRVAIMTWSVLPLLTIAWFYFEACVRVAFDHRPGRALRIPDQPNHHRRVRIDAGILPFGRVGPADPSADR